MNFTELRKVKEPLVINLRIGIKFSNSHDPTDQIIKAIIQGIFSREMK